MSLRFVVLVVALVSSCKQPKHADEACTTDSDCAERLVCQDGVRATKVCVPTCRPDVAVSGLGTPDERCPLGWECTASIGDRPVCAPLDRYRMTK